MMLHSSLSDLTCSSRNPLLMLAKPPATHGRQRGSKAPASDDSSIFIRVWRWGVVGGGVGALCAITEKKKRWICKKRIARLERVVSLPPTSPHNHLGSVAAKSRSSSRGNHEQLGHSCLHLTLRHHHISTAASWPGRSSPDTDLQPSADILSGIWHPFTLARRHRCGRACRVVFNDGIHAHLWLSTQNRTEFPRALVNVMFENGKLSNVTFTVVRGYCADLLLWPLGSMVLRMGSVFLSTSDQWLV